MNKKKQMFRKTQTFCSFIPLPRISLYWRVVHRHKHNTLPTTHPYDAYLQLNLFTILYNGVHKGVLLPKNIENIYLYNAHEFSGNVYTGSYIGRNNIWLLVPDRSTQMSAYFYFVRNQIECFYIN